MWTTGVQGFDTLPDGNRNEVRQVIADEARGSANAHCAHALVGVALGRPDTRQQS